MTTTAETSAFATDTIAERAAVAAPLFAATAPRDRARALIAVGDALAAAADELVEVAMGRPGSPRRACAGSSSAPSCSCACSQT